MTTRRLSIVTRAPLSLGMPRRPLRTLLVSSALLAGNLFAERAAPFLPLRAASPDAPASTTARLTAPPPLGASYPDASKGRPPIVLDARVGPNVRLGEDPAALPSAQRGQAEPHIVRSAANPELLLATFQDGRYSDSGAISCGYAVSRDGGLTWTRGLVPNLGTVVGGRFARATDPVAGAGPDGELYLQALATTTGSFAQASIVVGRSTDSGATWNTPVNVYNAPNSLTAPDKNWLAVNDYPGSANSGRLVSTWTNFVSNTTGTLIGTPLLASVSNDRGETWSTAVNITPDGSSNQGSQPVFLPDGSLLVVYTTVIELTNTIRYSISCKRSLDGGRTFPATANTVVGPVTGWDDPTLRDGIYLPSATVARQTGEIFVSYVALVDTTPRIFVTRSQNRGATWSTPVIASDQPTGISVMNPAVAVSPDGRTVSVVFVDKRNAPDGRNFIDHYAALSFDGGVTWQPNVRLSDQISDIRFGPVTGRGIMLGDYLGLAPGLAPDQPCVAIWCDTRTGDADPFIARFAPTPNADYETWRRARFSPSELADPTRTADGADFDGDGYPNSLEYALATDPRRPENGEVIHIQPAGNDLDIVWPVRSTAAEAAVISASDLTTGRSLPLIPSDLSPLQPAPLPAGLVWRSLRLPAQPAPAAAVKFTLAAELASDAGVQRYPGESTAARTDGRLINLSTRGRSGTGANQMTVGFVLEGAKPMLVRAAGPGLTALGLPDALTDPRLQLRAVASDLNRTNDNWSEAGSGASSALFSRLGAFPFAPASLDAALALDLAAQGYTATVSGANNAVGVTLVEAYDASPVPGAPAGPRLLNLSTRGEVGSGGNLLIAGFVLRGQQPRRVLIRAVGPGLAAFGLANPLADPALTLYRGDSVLAQNDDWETSRSSGTIAAVAARLGAFPLKAESLDAALLVTLPPGGYTVVISGAEGAAGLALVEVYDASGF